MNKSKYFQVHDFYPHLKNPSKYVGSRPFTIRSSWECSFVTGFLDKHTSVIEYKSETLIIPYKCPVRNYSIHRYFPDFEMKVLEKTGTIKNYIVEIKPDVEVKRPVTPKRKTKSYIDRVNTWIKNQAKWQHAKTYCEHMRSQGNNIEFVIMTEKGIYFENGKFDPIIFFKI